MSMQIMNHHFDTSFPEKLDFAEKTLFNKHQHIQILFLEISYFLYYSAKTIFALILKSCHVLFLQSLAVINKLKSPILRTVSPKPLY